MNSSRLVTTVALLLAVFSSVCATVYLKQHRSKVATVALEPTPVSIVLKAPEKAKVGQLVILDVSESVANSFKWECQQKTSNFLVIDGGRRAVFSAETGGQYTFVIAAAKEDMVDVKIHTIKVPSEAANPGDELSAKIASWCEPITSATKRDDALKLAQSFSSVCAVITDEMSPADIVEATKKSNVDALGSSLENWVPFLKGLQAELKATAEAGKLSDTESHRLMWRSVAEGLKEYAETLD